MSSVYVPTPCPILSTDMSFTLAHAPVPVISAQMEFTHDILEAWKRENDAGGNQGKIPKPVGEPGHCPETGGFPLKERLLRVEMWDEETYNDVTSAVRKAAQVALNLSVSFKFQEKAKVDIICAKMAHKWSFLNEYEDHWPAKSMLKAYLKYTSECA
ncbi:hypothetical protein PC9H_008851 [Pleurotus ostreatus]|uniref:Uncharacterized protein n=3 Tax=Pleurotus TaxID=5320 RepID=A0A067P8I6_PLEO1|nr:uncharacterized protein PC9H_008851 [Pleurotus ostreatus]KAF7426482.1 hypothetical protein PC9H_008851 [Pleurotus ostreatus]KAG9221946.1 hypothetical protein CCMSSC00406_0009154 [Pleurotus cornucopiae]KDQ32206.1 hypothetical protein PLEOSDRAFT_1100711 [Pleurotus ostreatus PC15]